MSSVQETGSIRVRCAYWHVDKQEPRFEIEIKTISGRIMKKVFGLP